MLMLSHFRRWVMQIFEKLRNLIQRCQKTYQSQKQNPESRNALYASPSPLLPLQKKGVCRLELYFLNNQLLVLFYLIFFKFGNIPICYPTVLVEFGHSLVEFSAQVQQVSNGVVASSDAWEPVTSSFSLQTILRSCRINRNFLL